MSHNRESSKIILHSMHSILSMSPALSLTPIYNLVNVDGTLFVLTAIRY